MVFARNFEEHLNTVDVVLDKTEKSGIKLKPERCSLFEIKIH